MSLSNDKGETALAVVRGSRKNDGRKLFINSYPGTLKDTTLLDGCLQVLPNPKHRNIAYVFGASGSGKSTWISNYVYEWMKQMEKKVEAFYNHKGEPMGDEDSCPGQMFCVSRKKLGDDDAFKDLPLKYLKIDESLIESPLSCDDLPDNCLVIFDDINSISPKKVNDSVQAFLRDVLEVGRARNINCVVSSHLGANRNETKTILNECQNIVFFPWGSSPHQIQYVLSHYGGMERKKISETLELPSRWVCLRKEYPPAIIYSSGAYLLNAK